MQSKKAYYVSQRIDRRGVWSHGCGTADDWEEANDQSLWMLRCGLTAPLQTQGLTTTEVVYRTPRAQQQPQQQPHPLTAYQRTEAARDAALEKAVKTLREIATWFWSELEKEGFRCISIDNSTDIKRCMVLAKDGNRAEVELSTSDYVNPTAGVKKLARQLQQFFLEHPSAYVHSQSQKSRAAALEEP
jgi:hypothetical protein